MKVSARFDDNLITTIDEIAENMNVTRSDILNDAVEMYVDYITWFKGQVQEGIDDIEAGRVFSHEEVVEKVESFLRERKK